MKWFWKRTGILVVALLMLCSAVGCGEEPDGVDVVGNLAFYDLGDGTYGVGVAEGTEKTIQTAVIPSTHQDKPVVKIVKSGFANCENLTSVTLSAGVTQIDAFAFSNCQALIDVTLTDTLTGIGNYAFSGCSALKSIVIPNGVTALGSYAFSFCGVLESITLSEGLQSIDEYTFYNCGALLSVAVPDSVTSIEKYAFVNCTKLTGVTIGSGVEELGQYVFDGCRSLSAVTVDDQNKNYASVNGILYDKPVTNIVYIPSKLSGDIVIPNGVTSIDSSAFMGMDQITSVSIPSSVTSIGVGAFSECIALERVTFANTTGWEADNFAIDATSLSQPEVAAIYLTDNYEYCAWKRRS